MKVFRIDLECGDYYTLTEKELQEQFTSKDLENLKKNENNFIFETPYTEKQLNKARRLRNDEDYCYNFEQEYSIAPSVYDILKHLY